MKRRRQQPKKATIKSRPTPKGVPPDLRQRLETTRLELLALFRALDQLLIAQDLPEELRYLFELDADFAEALWALDQPPGRLDFSAMTRDTLASLADLPNARQDFLDTLNTDFREGGSVSRFTRLLWCLA